MIAIILDRLEIRYNREHSDYKNETGHNFQWDFYLPDYHSIVEHHGRQHYEFIEHFHRSPEGFTKQLAKDRLRREYAAYIGCRYLTIPYTVTDEAVAEQMIRNFIAL